MSNKDYVINVDEDHFIGRIAVVDTHRAMIIAESSEIIQELSVLI